MGYATAKDGTSIFYKDWGVGPSRGLQPRLAAQRGRVGPAALARLHQVMNTLAEPRFKRRRRTVDLITADELVPKPDELVLQYGMPDTIAGWKALANGLLTNQSCVFHRNVEISARYAWIYKHLPACFKWAGMAAFASHHVRVALYPFRLDTDRTGYADIPRSLRRQRALLMEDVDTIRATNNAIFDDIFWVHLAYCAADDGIEHLRASWQRSATMPRSFPASR